MRMLFTIKNHMQLLKGNGKLREYGFIRKPKNAGNFLTGKTILLYHFKNEFTPGR